jgi:O-antigen ligase
VALVTLLGMVIQHCMNHVKPAGSALPAMVCGVLAAAVLSTLSTGDTMTALEDIGRLVILVVLVCNLVRSPKRYALFVSAVIALSVYLAIYSMCLFFGGDTIVQDGVLRSQGTGIFGDPNDLAATIVPALALIWVRFGDAAKAGKTVYLLAGATLLAATLLADSRGGMVALTTMFAAFVLTAKMSRTTKALTLAGAALLFLVGSGRMMNFDSQEASANSRFWFWDNGLQQLQMHPLFGVGYGQFASVNSGMVAHNSFVQCFAELGLVGYFFWIGSIYVSLRPMRSADSAATGAFLGSRIALVAYLVASFWLTHTYNPVLYVLLCLPLLAQATADVAAPAPRVRFVDFVNIAGICAGSIIFIKVLSDHYR